MSWRTAVIENQTPIPLIAMMVHRLGYCDKISFVEIFMPSLVQ
jgi:hypothetical protein